MAEMKDREFLKWIHERLELVCGDDRFCEHMHRLRCIIYATHPNQHTPISGCLNSLYDQLKKLEEADKIRPAHTYKRELSKGEF